MTRLSNNESDSNTITLILGNSNRNFSGVTATMLEVLKYQKELISLAVLGKHHLPASSQTLSFWGFIQLARNKTPKIFHARRNNEMIQALIAKYLFSAKIKIVFTATAQRTHSKFTQWLVQQMDGIITTSQRANAYLDYRPADIIIPHGVDLQRFTPNKNKQTLWQALNFPGTFGIGVFGRIRYSKGIDLLIQAALPVLKQYPHVTVIICGKCSPKDKTYQTQLKQTIGQAGLSKRILFMGEQPYHALPKLFQAMMVVAALSRQEGFGLTPLEAMAAKTAVLTSSAGAWPEIVRNGVDGFCLKTNNVAEISQKLNDFIQNPQKTLQMGMNGHHHVAQNFTVEQEAKKIVNFLQTSINNVPRFH